jgi:drug/metabolite transporter (DMT)-like permease
VTFVAHSFSACSALLGVSAVHPFTGAVISPRRQRSARGIESLNQRINGSLNADGAESASSNDPMIRSSDDSIPSHHGRARTVGVAMLIAASVLWSISGVALKKIHIDPIGFAFWRSLAGGIFLAALLPFSRGVAPRWNWMALAIVLHAIVVTLLLTAMALSTAAAGIILQYTGPVFCALFAWIFQRRRIGGRTIVALAIAMAGVAILLVGGLRGGTSVAGLVNGAISGVAFGGLILTLEVVNRRPAASPNGQTTMTNAGSAGSPNGQTTMTNQIPSTNDQGAASLVIGHSEFVGHCDLVIGASTNAPTPPTASRGDNRTAPQAPPVNALLVVMLNNLGTAAIVLPVALLFGRITAHPWQIAGVAVTGVVQLAVPYVLFVLALRRVEPVDASLLILLEPVLNPIWVWLAVGERPDLATFVGGAAILTAMVLEATKADEPEAVTG